METIALLYLLLASAPLCTSTVDTEMVNYAYVISGGNMEFVGTVAQESGGFDAHAHGDKHIPGGSTGYCQISKRWNPSSFAKYNALPDKWSKMDMCYDIYKGYEDRGLLDKRLYGHKLWRTGLKKYNISCE